jgi:hypothetical protein
LKKIQCPSYASKLETSLSLQSIKRAVGCKVLTAMGAGTLLFWGMAPCTELWHRVLSYGTVFWVTAPCSELWHRLLSYGTVYWVTAPCTELWLRVLSYFTVFRVMAPCSELRHRVLSYGTMFWVMAPCTVLVTFNNMLPPSWRLKFFPCRAMLALCLAAYELLIVWSFSCFFPPLERRTWKRGISLSHGCWVCCGVKGYIQAVIFSCRAHRPKFTFRYFRSYPRYKTLSCLQQCLYWVLVPYMATCWWEKFLGWR